MRNPGSIVSKAVSWKPPYGNFEHWHGPRRRDHHRKFSGVNNQCVAKHSLILQRVALNLYNQFDDGEYFRFNVDQGLKDITLSDWENTSTISAHTRNYLAKNERSMTKFVISLSEHISVSGNEGRPPTKRVHFVVPSTISRSVGEALCFHITKWRAYCTAWCFRPPCLQCRGHEQG